MLFAYRQQTQIYMVIAHCRSFFLALLSFFIMFDIFVFLRGLVIYNRGNQPNDIANALRRLHYHVIASDPATANHSDDYKDSSIHFLFLALALDLVHPFHSYLSASLASFQNSLKAHMYVELEITLRNAVVTP